MFHEAPGMFSTVHINYDLLYSESLLIHGRNAVQRTENCLSNASILEDQQNL